MRTKMVYEAAPGSTIMVEEFPCQVRAHARGRPPDLNEFCQTKKELVLKNIVFVDFDSVPMAVRDGGVRLGDVAEGRGVSLPHLSRNPRAPTPKNHFLVARASPTQLAG